MIESDVNLAKRIVMFYHYPLSAIRDPLSTAPSLQPTA